MAHEGEDVGEARRVVEQTSGSERSPSAVV
jgi:hypothetical protein